MAWQTQIKSAKDQDQAGGPYRGVGGQRLESRRLRRLPGAGSWTSASALRFFTTAAVRYLGSALVEGDLFLTV